MRAEFNAGLMLGWYETVQGMARGRGQGARGKGQGAWCKGTLTHFYH